jgi:hypothetical protein
MLSSQNNSDLDDMMQIKIKLEKEVTEIKNGWDTDKKHLMDCQAKCKKLT